MIRKVFSAFKHRDFRIMWMGACTSSIGTWMQKLAQSWLVLQLSGSPFLLGLDAFLGDFPILLFSMVGGVVADRMDRRKLLLFSQVLQMTSATVLAVLFATGVVKVWHILCLSFVSGIAQSFGGPAYQALLPTLVGPEDLKNALAMNAAQFNLARLIGPVVGGVALTQLGPAWCFGLNAMSFLAVIVSLVVIKLSYVPGPSTASIMESMRGGIDFISKRDAMPGLIVLTFLMTMLAGPLIMFLPVFARDILHGGPSQYTLLLSMSAVGSIFGALIVGALGQGKQQGQQALFLLVLLGGLMAAFGISNRLSLSCAILVITGAVLMGAFTTIGTVVQLIVPDEMRGRVMSVYNVAFRGGTPIGNLVAGGLTKVVSTPVIVLANGMALSVVGIYFLLRQKKVAAL